MTLKPTTLERASVVSHGIVAYKATPNNRHYAASDETNLSLGALTAAYAEQNAANGATSFDPQQVAEKVLTPLAKFLPTMTQQWRPGPEAPPPEPWKDALGVEARNPYREPRDHASIAAVERSDPALAEHLKRTADGVTYVQLAKQKEEKAKREQLRALKYGPTEHEGNVWRGNNITEQSAFARLIDPAAVESTNRKRVQSWCRSRI